MSFISSNFCIVADKLFWKGREVAGISNISYRKADNTTRISVIVENGDVEVINEMQQAGIVVRNRK